MVEGPDVLEQTRDQDAGPGPSVRAVHDGDVVAPQIQPALDAVTLGEDTVERGRLGELPRRYPRSIIDLILQLGLALGR